MIAVLNTEQEKKQVLTDGWDIELLRHVNIALASSKSVLVGIYFDSEEQ